MKQNFVKNKSLRAASGSRIQFKPEITPEITPAGFKMFLPHGSKKIQGLTIVWSSSVSSSSSIIVSLVSSCCLISKEPKKKHVTSYFTYIIIKNPEQYVKSVRR